VLQDLSFPSGFCYNLVCKVWNVLNGKFEGISLKEKLRQLCCVHEYEFVGWKVINFDSKKKDEVGD